MAVRSGLVYHRDSMQKSASLSLSVTQLCMESHMVARVFFTDFRADLDTLEALRALALRSQHHQHCNSQCFSR